jgi:hypothetical protein
MFGHGGARRDRDEHVGAEVVAGRARCACRDHRSVSDPVVVRVPWDVHHEAGSGRR